MPLLLEQAVELVLQQLVYWQRMDITSLPLRVVRID
jgi:hypothetical protein